VAIASVAARVPDYLAGGVHPSRAVLRVAESWYTVGPALVLCLAGATSPDWGDWTIYLGALGARFAFDFVASVAHLGVGLRMRVRPVANELVAIYSVDALLAPVGLLAAFAAATEPWASLLVLPLLGLIAIFAREREARIESVLTLRDAYRGTAHLRGEVLATTHEYTGPRSAEHPGYAAPTRRGGRAVECTGLCTGLESRQRPSVPRGFESHPLRLISAGSAGAGPLSITSLIALGT
jgi:hypothetical protein